VPGAELAGEADRVALQLAAMPTRAIGLTKRAFNASLGVALNDQLDFEEALQREAGRTSDYAEGVSSFLEKRTPVYHGR
jgi:2-(1,2-epoxy-1,2-dihydrophenyl)acetyl-CoA isomerase